MNKKITRWSLMNILFAILVSIPLWSIVVRTGYVLLNKNAYQSYGNYSEIELVTANNSNTLSGNNLYFSYKNEQGQYSYSQNYLYTFISVDITTYVSPSVNFDFVPDGIRVYSSGTINLHNPNTDSWSSYNGPNNQPIWGNTLTNFTITLKENVTNNVDGGNLRLQVMYTTQGKLDNVFDYSIDKFNSENDAHFDFVSNLANLFITEDSYGWRYITFVNWYFNYFVVISACYIVFLVIIWFIVVIRRIIERSMHLI